MKALVSVADVDRIRRRGSGLETCGGFQARESKRTFETTAPIGRPARRFSLLAMHDR
jgi:hypothetical protein